jgi:hypothetical protein
MGQPQSPLYLTTLEVTAYILFRLWLVIGLLVANNASESLLDSLLFTASNKWNISQEEIIESMNKIAFHESKGNPSAIQKSDETTTGIGPGRGLFQFEVGKNQGAHTAINRLISQLNEQKLQIPNFLSGLDSSDYDISVLSPEQQQLIFLGNILQMPDKTEKGYGPARFYDINNDGEISNEELAQYWAQYHQAGTKPDTNEYKNMLDKFTEDVQFYDINKQKNNPLDIIMDFIGKPLKP